MDDEISRYSRAGKEVRREIAAAVELYGRDVVYPPTSERAYASFGPDPEQVWDQSRIELHEAVVALRAQLRMTPFRRRKERRQLKWMIALADQRRAMADGMEITFW